MNRGVRAALWTAAALIAAWLGWRAFAMPAAAIEPRSSAVSFLDRSGTPLGVVLSSGSESSVAVPLARVSPFFIKAILAVEDRRFFFHGAVDWTAVARASWQSLRCLCGAGGASTITMQLARTQFDLPSGMRGKMLQMWDAARIEAGASKAQILNAYVNRVAMGGNVYGVEAAARTYFGVPASDLDLAQAALLAGLPNDPSRLEPRTHWRSARARQRAVLNAMVSAGYVTRDEAATAARETLHVRAAGGELIAAQQLLFRLAPQAASAQVRTTIDLPLQLFVQSQARDVVAALAGRNVTQAAALVIDNRSGDVLAYVGSTDYFDDAYLGKNDGVHTLRQPGSTLKPFLYEYALERRAIRPYTILADVPTSYAIPNGQAYSPEDYSSNFAGPVSVRIALANSLNVPAVRVLSSIGVPSFLARLQTLGFSDLRRSPDYYGLGLTLGAGEVTLWDLAHAYVTLARGGSAIPLRTIVDGASVAPASQIGDSASWELVADMLADRYARAKSFGVGSVVDTPFPSLVKTGTSSDYRDTWTVGATPEYTVAVWTGNFSGAPMRRIAGVTGAGPLWNRIMLHLYERRDPPRFPAPPGYRIISWAGMREYADAADARAMRAPRSVTASTYDEWRARQGDTFGALGVLFPHDGDVFEDRLAANDPRRAQQQIEFRISRPRHAAAVWELNGSRIAAGGGDAYFWPVRTGDWRLTVSSGRTTRSVHFRVIRRAPHGPRGFAISLR